MASVKELKQIGANKYFLTLSFSIFVASLARDAYMTGKQGTLGISLLLMGWLGLTVGVFEWLANPIIFSAWVFLAMRKYKLSMASSLLALMFGGCFLLRKKIVDSEGGVAKSITELSSGYWLWLVSMLIILGGAALCYKLDEK